MPIPSKSRPNVSSKIILVQDIHGELRRSLPIVSRVAICDNVQNPTSNTLASSLMSMVQFCGAFSKNFSFICCVPFRARRPPIVRHPIDQFGPVSKEEKEEEPGAKSQLLSSVDPLFAHASFKNSSSSGERVFSGQRKIVRLSICVKLLVVSKQCFKPPKRFPEQ